jgi:hypothetical protein
MEIRIIRRPPAPKMDGFDTSGLDVGRIYVVEDRIGRYLIDGGYAVAVAGTNRKEGRAPSRRPPGPR